MSVWRQMMGPGGASLRRALAAAAVCLCASSLAGAALFEDDDARRAILDLRQRLEAQRLDSERRLQEMHRSNEEASSQMRRSLLDLQAQLESLRGEIARLRGQDEQVLREMSEIRRRQQDFGQAIDNRLRNLEPARVTLDGRQFMADPREAREFEAALALFRRGDFREARTGFGEVIRRYPHSGFRPTALFWLGSAQYAGREYEEAIASFRTMLAEAPDHARSAEALLSVANCQIEMRDHGAARETLDELVKAYPESDAADAARERLSRLH